MALIMHWQLLLLFLILLAAPAVAQERVTDPPAGLLELAQEKDWNKVQAYFDSCAKNSRNNGFIDNNWQLVGPFTEATYRQLYYVPTDSLEGYYRQFIFNFLLRDKQVVYCRIWQGSGANRTVLTETLDEEAFADLVRQYKVAYGHTIGISDLFATSRSAESGSVDQYAQACGLGAAVPPLRIEMEQLLARGDIASLETWLSSPVAVRQVYAVEAFYRLRQKGHVLSASQLSQIKLVQKKKGKITTCAGCSLIHKEIAEVAGVFRF